MFVARGPSDATRASERVSPAIIGVRAWHGEGQALALREKGLSAAEIPVGETSWSRFSLQKFDVFCIVGYNM